MFAARVYDTPVLRLTSEVESVIRSSACQEISHLLDVSISILPMRHMRTAERYPADFRNSLEPRVHADVCDLIGFAVHEKRFNCNLMSLFPAFPTFDGSNDNEFGWTLAMSCFLSAKASQQVLVRKDKYGRLTSSYRLWGLRSCS